MKNKLILIVVFVIALGGGVLWWGHNHPWGNSPASNTAPTNDVTNHTQASPEQNFDKEQFSTDEAGSIWWVVNKLRPLSPLNYAPSDLVSIGNGQQMRAQAAAALANMLTDAKAAGYTLIAESGYRSYATQVAVYNNEVKTYGQAKAETESAKPGYSEHQTGWAVDIQTPGCMEDCFGKTMAAKWVLDNSYKYGFIQRYQTGKESITGYRAEPWHFRFVDQDLSVELQKTHQAMEEFFGLPAVGAP